MKSKKSVIKRKASHPKKASADEQKQTTGAKKQHSPDFNNYKFERKQAKETRKEQAKEQKFQQKQQEKEAKFQAKLNKKYSNINKPTVDTSFVNPTAVSAANVTSKGTAKSFAAKATLATGAALVANYAVKKATGQSLPSLTTSAFKGLTTSSGTSIVSTGKSFVSTLPQVAGPVASASSKGVYAGKVFVEGLGWINNYKI